MPGTKNIWEKTLFDKNSNIFSSSFSFSKNHKIETDH